MTEDEKRKIVEDHSEGSMHGRDGPPIIGYGLVLNIVFWIAVAIVFWRYVL